MKWLMKNSRFTVLRFLYLYLYLTVKGGGGGNLSSCPLCKANLAKSLMDDCIIQLALGDHSYNP